MKIPFKIGQCIRVRATVTLEYKSTPSKTQNEAISKIGLTALAMDVKYEDTRVLTRTQCNFEAIVTGACYRQEGEIDVDNSEEGYGVRYFTPRQTHLLVCVRRGLTNKEELALIGDIETESIRLTPETLPFRQTNPAAFLFSEENRKLMREVASDMKRDAKGRFIK